MESRVTQFKPQDGERRVTHGLPAARDGVFTRLTAYGENRLDNNSQPGAGAASPFFTGKPHIPELGYAFLLRNYRPDLSKWQTADPLGYPDGLNSFAYCNGQVTSAVDWLGAATKTFTYEDPVPWYPTEMELPAVIPWLPDLPPATLKELLGNLTKSAFNKLLKSALKNRKSSCISRR